MSWPFGLYNWTTPCCRINNMLRCSILVLAFFCKELKTLQVSVFRNTIPKTCVRTYGTLGKWHVKYGKMTNHSRTCTRYHIFTLLQVSTMVGAKCCNCCNLGHTLEKNNVYMSVWWRWGYCASDYCLRGPVSSHADFLFNTAPAIIFFSFSKRYYGCCINESVLTRKRGCFCHVLLRRQNKKRRGQKIHFGTLICK